MVDKAHCKGLHPPTVPPGHRTPWLYGYRWPMITLGLSSSKGQLIELSKDMDTEGLLGTYVVLKGFWRKGRLGVS